MSHPNTDPAPARLSAVQIEALLVAPSQPKRNRTTANGLWLVTVQADESGATIGPPRPVPGPSALAEALWDAPTLGRARTLRLWTLRGWPDWVMSGLTELLDSGQLTYRYLTIDGHRSTLRGSLAGRPIQITSLPCWTGADWQEWAESIDPREAIPVPTGPEWDAVPTELIHCVRCVAAVVCAAVRLDSGPIQNTAAAQARQVWRRWMGLQVPCKARVAKKGGGHWGTVWKCVPLADTPNPACHAARQGSYGLTCTQYMRGHVNAPVYVWDLSAAYLTALLYTRLPAVYAGQCPFPRLDALRMRCDQECVLALVRLSASALPYPTRLNGQTEFCVGTFWTWLCGVELERALAANLVTDCEEMYSWRTVQYDGETAHCLLSLGSALDERGWATARRLWRGVYSSICGSWATWVRSWRDTGRTSPLGLWAQWTEADRQTAEPIHWRSIAGRVQVREIVGDGSCARPIAYGCITAAVRTALELVRAAAPLGSVLCTDMDSIWLTERGHRWIQTALRDRCFDPWTLKHKQTFLDAWLDGDCRAVAQIGPDLIPVVPGVPRDARIEPDGRARWRVAAPWHVGGRPAAAKGIGYTTAVFNAEKLCKANDHPLREAEPWLELSLGSLREELIARQ